MSPIEDADTVNLIGSGFEYRDVSDGVPESLYALTSYGLFDVSRSMYDNGGPIYVGVMSWTDSLITVKGLIGKGGDLIGVILRKYADVNDSSGVCTCGDVAIQVPTCSSWTYSDWSTCTNSQQTRTVSSSSPQGCTGGNPVLTQSCTPTPVACSSWTYLDWSTCTNSQQTRTVSSSSPSGCIGGNPVLTQSCTTPTPVACSSWTYLDWSTCTNSQQTRTVSSSSPSGCTGGDPVLTQACVETLPTCTEADWACTSWSSCSTEGVKTRDCTQENECTGGTQMEIEMSCTPSPQISSILPVTIYKESEITILGTNFGNDCTYSDFYCGVEINQVLYKIQSNNWSDTSVKFKIPYNVTSGYVQIINTSGQRSNQFNFTVTSKKPEITLISPQVLMPGQTILTIEGKNFGNSYQSYRNQICFNSYCIYDSSVGSYLQTWSDTEITLKVPYFVSGPTGKIGLKLLNNDTGYYEYFYSGNYSVIEPPIIEWYYPEMAQGGVYVFSGYNFGNSIGRVVINGVNAEIVNWDDKNVEFKVPDNVSSGEMYIENADGVKSQEIQVSIIIVKTYSNDEYSFFQWYLETLNVDKAWDITEGSSDVIVAVIDSGVDTTHEDLKHSIWTNEDEVANNGIDDDNNGYVDDIHGWDFILDSNSTMPRGAHGTAVASLIAAKKDNGIGMAGVAPNITIMPLNIGMFDEKHIYLEAALYAIKYAVDNGADIINLSFSGPESASYYKDLIQYAYDNNVLVIAAAGNEYLEIDSSDYGPVCSDLSNNEVIGVAAINKESLKSSFSNYGPVCVDLVAPGEDDILVAVPSALSLDIPYSLDFEGTSFSSPLVAGIAALVKSKHPTWNVEEIKSVLLNTANNLDYLNLIYAGKLGEGLPNAYAALNASKPNVSYNYNPRNSLSIKDTNIAIEIKNPKITPIKKDEPVKNNSIDEGKTDKNQDSFPDTQGHKNEQAITYLRSIGIINGYADGTFKPEKEVNRAELLKIVIEGKGITPSADEYKNCFKDVTSGWYMPYVCYAKEQKWVEGYKNGTFKPSQTVNKVEAIKILFESQGVRLPETVDVKPFDDIGKAEWSAPYISRAKELGILEETGLILGKAVKMKRAGICENLYRLLTIGG
jgi:subtilisin family serine protease